MAREAVQVVFPPNFQMERKQLEKALAIENDAFPGQMVCGECGLTWWEHYGLLCPSFQRKAVSDPFIPSGKTFIPLLPESIPMEFDPFT